MGHWGAGTVPAPAPAPAAAMHRPKERARPKWPTAGPLTWIAHAPIPFQSTAAPFSSPSHARAPALVLPFVSLRSLDPTPSRPRCKAPSIARTRRPHRIARRRSGSQVHPSIIHRFHRFHPHPPLSRPLLIFPSPATSSVRRRPASSPLPPPPGPPPPPPSSSSPPAARTAVSPASATGRTLPSAGVPPDLRHQPGRGRPHRADRRQQPYTHTHLPPASPSPIEQRRPSSACDRARSSSCCGWPACVPSLRPFYSTPPGCSKPPAIRSARPDNRLS